MKVKAIIFDCFGVLSVDGWLPYKKKYFGHDEDLFDQATSLNKSADAGLIGYEDFLRGVADLAHVSLDVARKQIEHNPPNEELFEYIRTDLKPKYKLGMLSNAAADWLHVLFTPDQLSLFDATALSYELGFIKPDPRSYQTIAARLGVETDECVFIDDQPTYCEAAKEQGMQAVVYREFDQMREELEKLLA